MFNVLLVLEMTDEYLSPGVNALGYVVGYRFSLNTKHLFSYDNTWETGHREYIIYYRLFTSFSRQPDKSHRLALRGKER